MFSINTSFIHFLFSLSGLMLLCATGNLHTSWTVWQLLLYVYGFEEVKINIILAWFVGVAGGMMLGALLNSNWSKICIYVSSLAIYVSIFHVFPKNNLHIDYHCILYVVFTGCGFTSCQHNICRASNVHIQHAVDWSSYGWHFIRLHVNYVAATHSR